MAMGKEEFVESRISAMSLEQKVGQCLVLGYVGPLMTPEILRRIKAYTPSGIRVGLFWRTRDADHDPGCTPPEFAYRMLRTPRGTTKDFIKKLPVTFCTPEEYTGVLNTLKQASLDSDLGHPVHITFDHEGNGSADFYYGVHHTPHAMGMAHTKDPQLIYDLYKAIGDQYAGMGFSWSHSLVLDVNTNPLNPEINTRAFGETPEEVAEYAVHALRGWRDAGIIATGKHFPGRGESAADAHAGLPIIELSRAEMEKHIAPYRTLIEAGLPAVMTAHTAYPQLDPEDVPATLSHKILTGILKEELGFKGAITTDAMAMGGIVSRFEFADACIKALNAGADLLLLRDESQIVDETFEALVKAVEDGRLPLERIEDANRRSLGVKYDYGFFDENSAVGIKDPAHASDAINDSKTIEVITSAAKRIPHVVRDDAGVLPLKKDTKVLLVEQVHPLHHATNKLDRVYPSVFWMQMLKYSDTVAQVECEMTYTDDDRQRIAKRLDEADIIVMTNYHDRRHKSDKTFVNEMMDTGKPVVVVTNSPYPLTVRQEYKTVICTYGCDNHTLEQAAKIIYGA
jgi:beta-N-acetylhexosaminidase